MPRRLGSTRVDACVPQIPFAEIIVDARVGLREKGKSVMVIEIVLHQIY